jgi:dipeptidyl aminopeptidase/acylaminoacyl peptidase
LHVFAFDWRGFGESDSWPMEPNELSRSEFLRDYEAAIDFVKVQPEVNPEKIGLLGFSTGAYLSFAMAAHRSDVGAFVGRALMTRFDDLLEILDRLKPERGFVAPANYPKDLQPIQAAQNVRTPVFLIVGENDERTPPWMSRQIMEKLKGPKELWVVPGAAHGGPAGPELTDYPRFFERTAAFFHKHLR